MFNGLPNEIKKMIFARVSLMDLYQGSCVSQDWWALSMATCRQIREYCPFLEFQVNFCNEMMPKEEGWQWWMFVEFTDDKTIELFETPDKKMIDYFERKDIHVRKLIYDGDPRILSNLKEMFSYLQTLHFTPDFNDNYDNEVVVLPDGLKHLRLTINYTYPKSHLMDVFQHLQRVDSLHILKGQRILFDNIRFDKLKHLHLDMFERSTQDIKSLVKGSKQLSSVYLRRGLIGKEWLGLFPTNIKKIHLDDMQYDKAMTANAFVERQLMSFVCQDWTKICLFKSSNDLYNNDYNHNYVCKPQMLEEELEITIYEGETPSGLLESGKLQLKVLKLNDTRDTRCDIDMIVPKSVQHFAWSANQFEVINFEVLFEDISTITTLRINSLWDDKIQFSEFPHAVNLVSLEISLVDDITLASILRNCPSLKHLSIKRPQGMPFGKLPADLKLPSVKQLTIIDSKDSITNIVGHFPCLVDLHLQYVNMETVTIADLAKLKSVEFVWFSFVNVNDLDLVVNCLHRLSFPHLVMVHSCFNPSNVNMNESLHCVMGREKAFFRRYLASDSKTDFTRINIQRLSDFFDSGSLLYFKGVPSLHSSPWSKYIKITYDLQEFIANALVEIQSNSKK